jgi:hypothetical protein
MENQPKPEETSLSFDVGIKNLAYCALPYDHEKCCAGDIAAWNLINLVEAEDDNLKCCGEIRQKKSTKICCKIATYKLTVGDKVHGFCKKHLSAHTQFWTKEQVSEEYAPNNVGMCCHIKTTGEQCGARSKHKKIKNASHNPLEPEFYCGTHFKSHIAKRIKAEGPQLLKKLAADKHAVLDLQKSLVEKLDALLPEFVRINVKEVVIENQPSLLNPRMKAIASGLYMYFIIRGMIDKQDGLNLNSVQYMCPNNKLKVNQDNTIEVLSRVSKSPDSKGKEKYKLTKALGIQYTRQLLNENQGEWLEFMEKFKKKDDLCDAYLQGRYYLEFIKHKADRPKETKKPVKTINKKTAAKKTAIAPKAKKAAVPPKAKQADPTVKPRKPRIKKVIVHLD